MPNSAKVIVALDFSEAQQALGFATRLDPATCKLKVGFELFVVAGPPLVSQLVERGFDVFLDLKFHDIPNTVARAVESSRRHRVSMLTVHTAGGEEMMRAASAVAERPKLIGVTVLTRCNFAIS